MGEVAGRAPSKPWLKRVWFWLRARLTWLWLKIRAAAQVVGAWRLSRILMWVAVACAVIYLGIFAAVYVAFRYLRTQVPQHAPVDKIVYLEQGWGPSVTSEKRQIYYYTPQGTSFVNLRYRWFVALEQANSKEPFSDPDHMRSMGFIVDNIATPDNPYRLPVGFTRHFDPARKEEFLDVTCAACHTGELHVVGKQGEQVAIRIDGGQGMHAFTSTQPGQFGPALMAAMATTYLNPVKFNRFARAVLQEHYDEGKWALRGEFFSMLMATIRQAVTDHGWYPIDEGFGRTDAIARISNKVFGEQLDSANYIQGNAPVSYPAVWDAPRFDWVQYTGSVSQPLARNLGESLGVGAAVELIDAYSRPVPRERRFSSESMIENLVKIEETVEQLQPPKWPEPILGSINIEKRDAGRRLFEQHCAHCHTPCRETPFLNAITMPQRPSTNPLWRTTLIPIEEVGTDPQAALNFYNYRLNLEKTGLTNDEVGRLLGAELREREFRKEHFQDLREDFARWSAANSYGRMTEDNFLKAEDIKRQQLHKQMEEDRLVLRKAGQQPKLSAAAEARVRQQLDAISIRSASIGQALNYVGLMLRDRFFKSRSAPMITKPPTGMGSALDGWYRESTNHTDVELYEQELEESMNGWGALDIPQVLKVYKARPLAGVWATAPYLHNGSVPTLYEMLLPAEKRSKKFFISRMNFDPVAVGLVKQPLVDNGFWYETSIPGNLNIGHEFRSGYGGYGSGSSPSPGVVGPELTDEQRWALIEYLKVHVDEPKLCDAEYTPLPGAVQ